MTAAGAQPVSAYLVESDDDEAYVERPSVSRGEALELAERFWTATRGYASGRFEEGVELSLSFTRDEEDDFIELSTFGAGAICARHRFIDAWKLLWLVPMRNRRDLRLELHGREEVSALVEAYMMMPGAGAFRGWMETRGAIRAPYR